MNDVDGSALQRQLIVAADGDTASVHTVLPAGEAASHAVVLLPAIAGVNDYVARRARQLAADGYAVVVNDYFGPAGDVPDLSTPGRIGAAVAALDDRRVLANVGACIAWLGARGIARDKVGVLGFCIGGTYAVLSAALPESPACAVAYYGQLRYRERTPRKPVDPMSAAAELRVPLLGHFGDMDRLIDAAEIAEFGARLRDAQRHHELRTYGGAPHAFDEWFRPAAFRPVASAQAWQRTLTFLDWHLRQRAPARPSPGRSLTQGD